MCGICCVCGPTDNRLITDTYIKQNSCLYNRGPDSQNRIVKGIHGGGAMMMCGVVLHLRGELTPQPLQDPNGNILLWNGEIFGGIEVSENENDTRVLMDLLRTCAEPGELLECLARIQGPFAFIYWQERTQTIWFGRDVLGRRSLLWHFPDGISDVLVLSSVQIKPVKFEEVPAVGIFALQIQPLASQDQNLKLYPWQQMEDGMTVGSHYLSEHELEKHEMPAILKHISASYHLTIGNHKVISCLPNLNKDIPVEFRENPHPEEKSHSQYLSDLLNSDPNLEKLTTQLIDILQKAVCVRVFNQPRGRASGAYGCSHLKEADDTANPREIIGNPRGITHLEYCSKNLNCDMHKGSCARPIFSPDKLCEHLPDCADDEREHAKHVNSLPSDSSYKEGVNDHASVAVLFSGGLDSAVLAALADRCVPEGEPIDLINVAFEKQPKQSPAAKNKTKLSRHPTQVENPFMVPDRVTGLTALAELNPKRHWNFVECNITLEELRKARKERVSELLYPLCSVLDDSIGCAVWFAARGQGCVKEGANMAGEPYTSEARVILVGMGADEQLAGYSRHRSRFQEHGWHGLADEIEMEVKRISMRNLGRDDRIITDHGKESRFPFLDENVVSFLSGIPLHFKADLTLPRGLGEKLLLRLCAIKLRLYQTAVAPKRAIQFGSRIAKMENSKERASDVCQRLLVTDHEQLH